MSELKMWKQWNSNQKKQVDTNERMWKQWNSNAGNYALDVEHRK